MVERKEGSERMRLALNGEDLPFGIFRPNHMRWVYGDEFARKPRIVGLGPIPKLWRLLAAGCPIHHRQCDVEILGQHRYLKPLDRSVNMRVATKPALAGHVDPTLQPDL